MCALAAVHCALGGLRRAFRVGFLAGFGGWIAERRGAGGRFLV